MPIGDGHRRVRIGFPPWKGLLNLHPVLADALVPRVGEPPPADRQEKQTTVQIKMLLVAGEAELTS